jgi:hypothetical protein
LFKIERLDFKRSIDFLIKQVNEKVDKGDFKNYAEKTEREVSRGIDELRIDI